jgi:hypothetical protein
MNPRKKSKPNTEASNGTLDSPPDAIKTDTTPSASEEA